MNDNYLVRVDPGGSATEAMLFRPDDPLIAEASSEVPIDYLRLREVDQQNIDFHYGSPGSTPAS